MDLRAGSELLWPIGQHLGIGVGLDMYRLTDPGESIIALHGTIQYRF